MSTTHTSRNPHFTSDPLPEGEGIDPLLPPFGRLRAGREKGGDGVA